jgi:uncharacterized protein
MAIFRTTLKLKKMLDEFFDVIDQGIIIFKHSVDLYLVGDIDKFIVSLNNIRQLKEKSDKIRKEIENRLYVKSLMPQFRGDVINLLKKTDDILNIAKSSLSQFEIERPVIPATLHHDLRMLTDISVESINSLVPAERVYFRDPIAVRDYINKVYFYENEADKLANEIKRKIFQNMNEIDLSQKIHLRYFTLHIENLSDASEAAADLLSIMAIKRTL